MEVMTASPCAELRCTFQENFAINPALVHVYNNVKVSKYNTETTGTRGGLSIHINRAHYDYIIMM